MCRTDGGHNNLRTAAYEALMSLIKHSAKDCYTVIQETTQIVIGRLQQAVQMDVSLCNYLCHRFCNSFCSYLLYHYHVTVSLSVCICCVCCYFVTRYVISCVAVCICCVMVCAITV